MSEAGIDPIRRGWLTTSLLGAAGVVAISYMGWLGVTVVQLSNTVAAIALNTSEISSDAKDIAMLKAEVELIKREQDSRTTRFVTRDEYNAEIKNIDFLIAHLKK